MNLCLKLELSPLNLAQQLIGSMVDLGLFLVNNLLQLSDFSALLVLFGGVESELFFGLN